MEHTRWQILPEQASAFPVIGNLHFCDKKDLILPSQNGELETIAAYLSRNRLKYQQFLRQKSRHPATDIYAAFQPFNEAFKALFPFVDYIKNTLKPGDTVLNLWDRSGWTASMLAGWFPQQKIVTVWEGDKDILGYKGFDYWMSPERRPNHTVVFTDFLRPMPFESNCFSAIIGMDLLHRFNQPELISELNRIAKPTAPILFPHVHLSNSEPEPYFDRGCRQLHGMDYDFLFGHLEETTKRKGYVLSEPASFQWNQNSADTEKILVSEPNHSNYNACIAWLPADHQPVLKPWRGHEQPDWEESYLLQNPLLTIHPVNNRIEFNIKNYGELIEELLERHAVYEHHVKKSIGIHMSEAAVEMLYWAGLGKTLKEIIKITGLSREKVKTITTMFWKSDIAQTVPVDESGFRLQHLLGQQQYIPERKENNLNYFWKQMVAAHSSLPCVKTADEELSFEQSGELVTLIQKALLNEGLKKGDKILLCSDLHMETMLVFWAACSLGIILIPLSPKESSHRIGEYIRLVQPALAFVQPSLFECIETSGCKAIMIDLADEPAYNASQSFEHWLSNQAERDEEPESAEIGEDIAVILWTTGTTGNPKGIPLTHAQLIGTGRAMTETYHWKKTDRYYALGGLETMSGLRHATVASAEAGCCCILPGKNKNIYEHLKTILDEKVTILAANPVFFNTLRSATQGRENLLQLKHSIRLALCTGNQLTSDLKARWHQQTGLQLLNYYGLTETSGICIAEKPGFSNAEGQSIGLPVGCLIKIVDEQGNTVIQGMKGELCIYGRAVFSGYYKNETATAACLKDGWFHTRDIASQQEDGSIFLYGRISDIVKLPTGERVDLNALDEVMQVAAGVEDWAFCPIIENEKESIALYMVLQPDVKEEEVIISIRSLIGTIIGNYAMPAQFQVISQIPRGNHNKVIRTKLPDKHLN
jgi:acyl-coenzyme A synthetase/AMP-(fatty) acid ligase